MLFANSKSPVLTLRLDHRLTEIAEITDASADDVLFASQIPAQPGKVAELMCEAGFPTELRSLTGGVHWVQQERRGNRIAVALPYLAHRMFWFGQAVPSAKGFAFPAVSW